jgi:hypothetical protein
MNVRGGARAAGDATGKRRPSRMISRSKQFDGREIEIIDGLPDWSSRTSIETAGMRGSPW